MVEYKDDALGIMPDDEKPVRITEIRLRPRIVIAGEASDERVRKLVQTAHEHCFVANSLTTALAVEPSLERRERRRGER